MRSSSLLLLLLTACANTDTGTKDTADTQEPAVDADGDGSFLPADCDDTNANVHPGATEVCNDLDDDCDGGVDVGATDATTWYFDGDDDTYGDETSTASECHAPVGYVAVAGDCNDDDPAIHPAATEDDCADPTDYNCDGSVQYADLDSDGAAACHDCDDTDPARHPGADEVCNTLDDDCDTLVDDADTVIGAPTWYADGDGDGYAPDDADAVAACLAPVDFVDVRGDCDDARVDVNPGATEQCDVLDTDEDCNGLADDADPAVVPTTPFYEDDDGDTHGDALDAVVACDLPAGFSPTPDDCDDTDPTIHPGADELCNGLDEDCDTVVDNDPVDGGLYATDADDDGFGAEGTLHNACDGATNDWDCDDSDVSEPVYVDGTLGSPVGAGNLYEPLDTVQAGLDQATECVVVRAGVYAEAIDFGGKDLRVRGVDGAEATVLDATSLGVPVVTFAAGETEAANLTGFTLTGGQGHLTASSESVSCGSSETCTTYYNVYCGGGVYVSASSPTLSDVLISDNRLPPASTTVSGNDTAITSSFGGGVCLSNSAAMLSRVSLVGNFANVGGGAYVDPDANVAVDRARLEANSAAEGGGIFLEGGLVSITNALFSDNAATVGGAIGQSGGTMIANHLTVADNADGVTEGLGFDDSAAVTIANSILTESDPTLTVVAVRGSAVVTVMWTDAWNAGGAPYSGMTDPTGTDGNVNVDPGYVATDDHHLAAGSVCIDAADPSELDPDGSRADMGAWGGPGGSW